MDEDHSHAEYDVAESAASVAQWKEGLVSAINFATERAQVISSSHKRCDRLLQNFVIVEMSMQ